ncbi:MAG TPA: DUF4124 domain-containing protein [Chromatiales bacterium]|nr:DUF4124 domain-containing protein [Chromatiales bacterium]
MSILHMARPDSTVSPVGFAGLLVRMRRLAVRNLRAVRPAGGLVALLVLCLAGAGAEARLYRWTDENGVVHFSDRVPPEAARKERRVYDEEGDLVTTVPAAKTAEQIEAERRRAEAERRRREAAERQAREDRALMQMYGSLADIEAIRDERLELIDTAIGILETKERKLVRKLRSLDERITALRQQGKKPSGVLMRQYDGAREALEATRRELMEQRSERLATEERFRRDMERFTDLLRRREARGQRGLSGE